ncbi:ethylbenzene dehydrogenase-related protein [Halodesulfovibrio spirochaetisodalis]|uniref:Ethylbenzene dehydrogenase n=1 Tax=Halodesulfovibrio spirochaetisodalis TaxID=1560234 RepID=A0A1B7X9H5_9BACT|nr:ethylbenzene dehydrogenase-related protein [Halodesulfovibrio spirochaetisodalis]OBQ45997.1 ethylbenzene dehydrogenase [Halodesulfovibrio spirochaetisodalis]
MKKNVLCIVALMVAAFVANSAFAADQTLYSAETSSPILLDGKAESAWDKAKEIVVTVDQLVYEPNNGYEGMKETDVRIKSLHDENFVYFLITYKDPTKSLARFPWVKQKDGSWKKLANKDTTGHDNTYYEDKFSIYWNINTKGFESEGCMISCHLDIEGDTSAGRKFTASAGETIDMWHAKYVRSLPMGMFDDQYVDSNTDPKKNKSWGRKGDTGKGGYKNNDNADKTAPAYMNLNPTADEQYYVIPSKKVPFVDTFKEGDIVPGISIAPMQGGRADVLSRIEYKDGQWTLEVKRALRTKGKDAEVHDVQFIDKTKAYPFGIAVFDNSQINHLFHNDTLELRFK